MLKVKADPLSGHVLIGSFFPTSITVNHGDFKRGWRPRLNHMLTFQFCQSWLPTLTAFSLLVGNMPKSTTSFEQHRNIDEGPTVC